MKETIIAKFERQFRAHADKLALTDYSTKEDRTYLKLAENIARYHVFFDNAGINRGDKIALMCENSTPFITAYIAIISYGAVAVPILPGFNPIDAAYVINHSDSRILVVDDHIWEKLKGSEFEHLEAVLNPRGAKAYMTRSEKMRVAYDNLFDDFDRRYPDGFAVDDIKYAPIDDQDIMVISYTSGTTGNPKGVMLTGECIYINAQIGDDWNFYPEGTNTLDVLPLAHSYAAIYDMISPLSMGAHITVLGRTPAPTILMQALAVVKPKIFFIVPLLIEKVVKANFLPLVGKVPYEVLREKLVGVLGGNLEQLMIGGAPLDPTVEQFLRDIKLLYTVGYGMTEVGPLIGFTPCKDFKQGSTGKLVPALKLKLINKNAQGIGEVLVKGAPVMRGYYKNPEATAMAIDAEGWLHTGDMGYVDDDMNITLVGRCKSMILGAGGQNIYPEEIEFKLNRMPLVAESIVYDAEGVLKALVVPNLDEAQKSGLDLEKVKEIMLKNMEETNAKIGSYEQLREIVLCAEPFVKTAKGSIKRFLYPQNAKLM